MTVKPTLQIVNPCAHIVGRRGVVTAYPRFTRMRGPWERLDRLARVEYDEKTLAFTVRFGAEWVRMTPVGLDAKSVDRAVIKRGHFGHFVAGTVSQVEYAFDWSSKVAPSHDGFTLATTPEGSKVGLYLSDWRASLGAAKVATPSADRAILDLRGAAKDARGLVNLDPATVLPMGAMYGAYRSQGSYDGSDGHWDGVREGEGTVAWTFTNYGPRVASGALQLARRGIRFDTTGIERVESAALIMQYDDSAQVIPDLTNLYVGRADLGATPSTASIYAGAAAALLDASFVLVPYKRLPYTLDAGEFPKFARFNVSDVWDETDTFDFGMIGYQDARNEKLSSDNQDGRTIVSLTEHTIEFELPAPTGGVLRSARSRLRTRGRMALGGAAATPTVPTGLFVIDTSGETKTGALYSFDEDTQRYDEAALGDDRYIVWNLFEQRWELYSSADALIEHGSTRRYLPMGQFGDFEVYEFDSETVKVSGAGDAGSIGTYAWDAAGGLEGEGGFVETVGAAAIMTGDAGKWTIGGADGTYAQTVAWSLISSAWTAASEPPAPTVRWVHS